MSQLCPTSLDWYRASYVHERLAVRRATPSWLTPGPLGCRTGPAPPGALAGRGTLYLG